MPTYTIDQTKYNFEIDGNVQNRYKLKIRFVGEGAEDWLIILKNPSKAGGESKSDKTINSICSYFSRKMPQVGTLTVMNLFAIFKTDAKELQQYQEQLIDSRNQGELIKEIALVKNVVLAWGKHPPGCKSQFDEMKLLVLSQIGKKECFQMKHPRRAINIKRPLHAQVWGYDEYELVNISADIVADNK